MTIASSRSDNEALESILNRLRAAFFPYFDGEGRFCWDCRDTRTVIWLNDGVVAKAGRLLRRIPLSFQFTQNQSFDEVLAKLSNPFYKNDTWVRGEVVDVYRVLRQHGYMCSIEARTDAGLAGAVLGIDLGECFIVETMLSVASEGSKAALCHAVEKFAASGYPFIDVQRPHPPDHPCARLLEETMPIDAYRTMLTRTLARGEMRRSAAGPVC